MFGPPPEGDGYKVSGNYVLTDDAGNVFTVYDWKATSLFDDDAGEGGWPGPPTPEEFWANRNRATLHIGGRKGKGFEAFRRWLLERTAEPGG